MSESIGRLAAIKARRVSMGGFMTLKPRDRAIFLDMLKDDVDYLIARVGVLERVREAAEQWRGVSARRPSGKEAAEAWQRLMTALLEVSL